MIKVLFVCIGNICRSPMAEAIFKDKVKKAGLEDKFEIDSAGTINYHEGEKAHALTRKVCKQRNIEVLHLARPIRPKDLFEFHYILNMETSVQDDVLKMSQSRVKSISKIELMRSYDPDFPLLTTVPDPYNYEEEAFEDVYQILDRSLDCLLDKIKKDNNLV